VTFVVLRQQAAAGWSLARSSSARAVQRCFPTATAANGGRIEASPASGVSIGERLSGSPLCGVLATSPGWLRKG